jgi:ribosomal protein S18 acetylase RimI-like enzyme
MLLIRKATISDAPSIIDFQKNMAWETEQIRLHPDLITKGVNAVFNVPSHGQYYVAESDGIIAGSLLITYEWSDWRNADVWWFQSVYIMPEYRRLGIFRKMYSAIMEEAGTKGIAGLRLYVESNNTRARQTYEALGMTSEHYTMYEWLRE